jgi:hypothetical protein
MKACVTRVRVGGEIPDSCDGLEVHLIFSGRAVQCAVMRAFSERNIVQWVQWGVADVVYVRR